MSGTNTKKAMSKQSKAGFVNYGIVIAFFVVFQALSMAGKLSNSLTGQLIPICVYVTVALALNLVVGISGELSLGHAGFMSVGAFSGVIIATTLQNTVTVGIVRLILAVIIGAVFAAIAGFIIGIPVLRLRGDYLAIVTLAFGEIIKNVLNCLYVGVDSKGIHFSMSDAGIAGFEPTGTMIINGPMGAMGIKKIATFPAAIIMVILALIVIQHLINSRNGRAIMALRDNRIAAEATGINVTKYKLMAFVTSAFIAGAAGAMYALNFSTVVPKKFDFNTSILILVFVVLGGIGNIRGTIIAAAILYVLPELLRQFSDYRMLVYAIVLILVMLITNNDKAKAFLGRLKSKEVKEDV